MEVVCCYPDCQVKVKLLIKLVDVYCPTHLKIKNKGQSVDDKIEK